MLDTARSICYISRYSRNPSRQKNTPASSGQVSLLATSHTDDVGQTRSALYFQGGLAKLSGVTLGYVFAGFAGPGSESRVEHCVEQADGPAERTAAQGEEADAETANSGEKGQGSGEGERISRAIQRSNADCAA